jgi:hypothetical protein
LFAVTRTQAERGGRIGDRQFDAAGIELETVGDVPEQQQCGGAQRRQPKRLDITIIFWSVGHVKTSVSVE